MNDIILQGRAEDVIPTLLDGSISLVVTSPPYAQQRRKHYGGIAEADYPEWIAGIMEKLKPKMAPDGSVLINLRAHVRDGVLSDYVLRSRLTVRDRGWFEIDELIWHSPDKPPLGHVHRPRRAYESVLWYSPTSVPFVDLRATTTRPTWQRGGIRIKDNGWTKDKSVVHGDQRFTTYRPPRITDVLTIPTGSIDRGVDHPAMFPRSLASTLIRTFSRPDDLVLDPFAGSATTVLAALDWGRRALGIERSACYAKLCRRRIAAWRRPLDEQRRAG